MPAVTAETLSKLKFFAGISPESLKKVAAISRVITFEKDRLILLEDDPNTPVFFVVSGDVRVFRTSPEGREITIATLHAGEPFNIPSAFTPHPNSPASAAAVTDATVLSISQQEFQRVVSETPDIALVVLRDLSQKLQKLVALSYDLGLRSVRGRLAKFLLENIGPNGSLPRRWTQQQIAAHIGTAREVVSRTLRQFSKAGIITTERQRITIVNPDALEKFITQ